MRLPLLISALGLSTAILAQPPQAPLYTINQISLPEDMNKQVCISGMKYFDGKLYFASERCPEVISADPAAGTMLQVIPTHVPQNFEMEGMTSYKNKLYLVSENTVAVYQLNLATGNALPINISIPLPPKSTNGDGMEGIAANETHNRFYLLRERTEDLTRAQLYTFRVEEDKETIRLQSEAMIELPLETPQWRYSDICYDAVNNRLLCLKSFEKGRLRQQYIESIDADSSGQLLPETRQALPIENFSTISRRYKEEDYSMNLEGITLDPAGNIFVISDNTSGKAQCELPAKEKTILLELIKR